MELPIYRNPGLRMILRHMWRKGVHYLKKMGGVILIASVVIWVLGYFPRETPYSKDFDRLIEEEEQILKAVQQPGNASALNASEEKLAKLIQERDAERQENSFIGRMGKAIEPVIRPLGFDWKMGISLVTGFAAKEIVVSTMGVLYRVEHELETVSLQTRLREQVYLEGPRAGEAVFTPLAGISFLLFVLFYLPCVAVITAVGKESGSWKWAGFVLFYTTAIAWMASFLVYQVGSLLQMG
jgi:ferrous iron transport protein B